MIDLRAYYNKLADHQSIGEAEIEALLKELSCLRNGLAYLASCQAATLEGLPRSASKASRKRYAHICENAAAFLEGDDSKIRHPDCLDEVRNRCLRAIRDSEAKT